MTFPKFLIIGGVKWKIIFNHKEHGGAFYWHAHEIVIGKHSDERKLNILLHEIIEAIMVNNAMRFEKTLTEVHNGDFRFVFNHDQFEIFTDELSGILKQFMRTK